MFQMTNDFNISTPVIAEKASLDENYHEFGRLIEELVFGKAVKWTASDLPAGYLERVIKSVNEGDAIPTLIGVVGILERLKPTTMALDFEDQQEFF